MRLSILVFFLSASVISCTSTPKKDNTRNTNLSEKIDPKILQKKDFKGTYLSIPPKTILKLNDPLEFKQLNTADLRVVPPKLGSCKIYRRAVNPGVARTYKFPEGSTFEVLGPETDMPLDMGEKAPRVSKAGTVLSILFKMDGRKKAKEKPDQMFGILCKKSSTVAQALKNTFSSDIFVDEEIER